MMVKKGAGREKRRRRVVRKREMMREMPKTMRPKGRGGGRRPKTCCDGSVCRWRMEE